VILEGARLAVAIVVAVLAPPVSEIWADVLVLQLIHEVAVTAKRPLAEGSAEFE
jgi:hypothetical protein